MYKMHKSSGTSLQSLCFALKITARLMVWPEPPPPLAPTRTGERRLTCIGHLAPDRAARRKSSYWLKIHAFLGRSAKPVA
jgi:hypothetical protein